MANPPLSILSIALLTLALLLSNPCKASARLLTQPPPPIAKYTNFIRTSCNHTTYPALCFTTLSSYASTIQSNPAHLASTALSKALTSASSTYAAITTISKTKGMSPRVAAAMADCREVMADSVDELKQSMETMATLGQGRGRSRGYAFRLNSVQTWVSAAITDYYTCTDGFEGRAMDGKVKTAVRREVVKAAQLTSNALALVNVLAAAAESHSAP